MVTAKSEQNRASGAVDRETYLSVAESKRVQAHTLKAQEGLSVRAIAKPLNISVGAVVGYLKEQPRPGCSKSVSYY